MTGAEVALLLGMLDRVAALTSLLQQAQGEGRDLTSEELEGFRDRWQVSDDELTAAIEQAKAEGR